MLFRRRFHEGIRSGAIRCTYRIWKAAKVKMGGRYRLGPDGVVEVESVETGPLGEISSADARLAGFEDRDALRDELRRSAKTRVTARPDQKVQSVNEETSLTNRRFPEIAGCAQVALVATS